MICMSRATWLSLRGRRFWLRETPTRGEVEIDSRRVGEGSLFVAFAGESRRNSYIDAALMREPRWYAQSVEPAQATLEHARRVDATLLRGMIAKNFFSAWPEPGDAPSGLDGK